MIFISYSSKDQEIANSLYKILNDFQLAPFMASESIIAGNDWKNKIIEKLNESSIVLILLTENSISSQAVLHEIGAALFTNKVIIPIKHNIPISRVPAWISNYQVIDYKEFSEEVIENLFRKKNSAGSWLFTGAIVIALMFFLRSINENTKNNDQVKKRHLLKDSIQKLFVIMDELNVAFPHKKFTLDGRLVGDIGEVIAELDYDILIFEKIKKDIDGYSTDGRRVQIKVSFKDKIAFKGNDEYLIALKIDRSGNYKEVFNGPSRYIIEYYKDRKDIGAKIQSLPINILEELSRRIPTEEKISKRKNLPTIAST